MLAVIILLVILVNTRNFCLSSSCFQNQKEKR